MNVLASSRRKVAGLWIGAATVLLASAGLVSLTSPFQDAGTGPVPLVAIHVSELTQALESIPARPPTPNDPGETTGYEWYYPTWHYFVAYESLKEALRSDGTPFVEVSDADIANGRLLDSTGAPRYPIVFSLDAEAVDTSEIVPMRDYVSAGGFLFVGSSALTRRPDGTTRGDFVLADEMGIHLPTPSVDNWDVNKTFTKKVDHRLTAGIPTGVLNWRMPLSSEEIPLGVSPSRVIHWAHYTWRTAVTDATVLVQGSSAPLLATKKYGKGNFIYHSVIQPLIGHGGFDSGLYAYLIYRNAIQWAFESAALPIIRLSPWRYPYDAAFMVRHDFENDATLIRSIESSAAFDRSAGAKGEYYFCTGTLRDQMSDKTTVVAALKRAVTNSGTVIGPHNGGLKNPVNLSLAASAYDYWHWGPDEALDTHPSGYASGLAYAQTSISAAYQDVAGWLAGTDNGRAGCGARKDCPRVWAAPCFNSTREASYALLDQLGVITVGEQKISPFPHWTVSTQTAGKRYGHLTLPVSDWYSGADVLQTLDDHTSASMRQAVDFYYGLGTLINLYGHNPSASGGLQGDYITYTAAKSRIWASNSVMLYDWWQRRSAVTLVPSFIQDGGLTIAHATISGATDTDTTVEIALPASSGAGYQILLDGFVADPASYRVTTAGTLKIRVGASTSDLEVDYGTSAAAFTVGLNPTTVAGGKPVTGTVTLTSAAPAGGVPVTLTSDNTAVATVPAGVTVASGRTSATFTITTFAVTASTKVGIKASASGSSVTTALTVTPAQLVSVTLSPTSIVGGKTSTGTITLSGNAPGGGAIVSLSSGNPVASVPPTVTVPAGNSSTTFTVTTGTTSSSVTATISAVYAGVTASANLTVTAQTVSLASLSVTPTTLSGGHTATGTVVLAGAAPAGGATVSLSSSNTGVAVVGSSVTVPAGNSSATFTITTKTVSYTRYVTISASYGGATRTARLTVTR